MTKRDWKLIEKLHAKIEYLEIRDEHDQVEFLLEQIEAIQVSANCRALKKAEKIAAAEWAARRAEKRAAAELAAKKNAKKRPPQQQPLPVIVAPGAG